MMVMVMVVLVMMMTVTMTRWWVDVLIVEMITYDSDDNGGIIIIIVIIIIGHGKCLRSQQQYAGKWGTVVDGG